MNVLILGGTGHIGQLIQHKTRNQKNLRITAGNRKTLNLKNPESFSILDHFDVVINATDTYHLPPFDLYRYCLARPITLFETTAESEVYLKLRDLDVSGPGRIITGMGIFPGLSNLFVGHHDLSCAKKVQLVISWSLFSEAGAGTIEVMIGAMQRPTWRWQNGQLQATKIMGEIQRFDNQVGMEIGLPEPIISGQEIGVDQFQVFAATKPALPKWLTQFGRFTINTGIMKMKPIEVFARIMFRIFRKQLLAGKATQCQMTVWQDDKAIARLEMDNAFSVAGSVIAAGLTQLQSGQGIQTPNQCFGFGEILQQIQDWAEHITYTSF